MVSAQSTKIWAVLLVGLLIVGGMPVVTSAQQAGTGIEADFSISPQRPVPFEPVKFDASQTTVTNEDYVQYRWTYETSAGTQTEYGESFVHTFEADGSYEVELRVEDGTGNIDIERQTVVIDSDDPIADYKTYPSNPGLNERVTFNADPSEAPDVEIGEYEWFINGEPQRGDRTMEVTFEEPDLYTVALKVTDRAGQTDRISRTIPIGDKDEIYDNPAFDLERSAPDQDVYVNPDETVLFASEIESSELPRATKIFSVDGTIVSRSDVSSDSIQSTHQFSQLGDHTVAMEVRGVAGQRERIRWDVTTHPFNSAPAFSEQSSEQRLDVDGNVAILTFSVQNPSANTRDIETEILTKLPDGLSITAASDVSSGDAAIQTATTAVQPGQQGSMALEISVSDDSLAGKRLTIPYQIRYHPKGDDEIIYTADEQDIEIVVTDGETQPEPSPDPSTADDETADSSPGFGITAVALGWLGVLVLARRVSMS